MKRCQFSSCSGSAITSAAVSAAILSILVAGMLAYLGNENLLNYRSHAWTQSLHLAEAAVEIGFAEYEHEYFVGGVGFQSARGWSGGGGNYAKTVTNFTDTAGNMVGSFTVFVTGVGTANPQITGIGTCNEVTRGGSVSRAVRATLQSSSKFPVALMSKKRLDLNGNNIYTDSYDSTDSTKSTGGQYDSSKRQPNGDVASNDVLINSVNIGNADVYGQVYTGTGGTVAMGANGSIGPTFDDLDRATTATAAETAGWVRHDFSVDVPDVTVPTALQGASHVPGSTIDNNMTIDGGDWKVSSISLAGSKTLTITGTVRLYVTGDINVAGNGGIVISPGAKLEVYAAGSLSIAGNGVANQSGASQNSQFFGLPTSTSWSISGNGQWVGTIYAPQADFAMNGGGSAGDMSGAVVANSITLNGHVRFHYDESLKGGEFSTGYIVASWQELRNVSGSWVP